jgi:hypothetical protein
MTRLLSQVSCANADVTKAWCSNPGTIVCPKCRLVAYCCEACQVTEPHDT